MALYIYRKVQTKGEKIIQVKSEGKPFNNITAHFKKLCNFVSYYSTIAYAII